MRPLQRDVYFARRADGTGPIKIGCSSCPFYRVKEIGFGLRAKIEVLAAAPGGFAAERALHAKFAVSRVRLPTEVVGRRTPFHGATEWFDATPALLALIAEVKVTASLGELADDRRAEIMAARYLAGATLKAIGNDFGLSHERVRQVLRANGVPARSHRRWANQYRRAA